MDDELYRMLERMRKGHTRSMVQTEIPQYECPKCKDMGFLTREDESGREVAYKCSCYAVRQARDMMKRSGIPAEFQEKTFENFMTKGDSRLINAKTKAMQYVEKFQATEHDRHNSIIFCGQVGAGKTHLGTAVCGALRNGGVEVLYMSYRNAVTRIKQNIINADGYSKELNPYTSARVLYIDDLFKGSLTKADVNIMYEIVNYRYMNNLPVIISTGKSLDELIEFDEATGSRMIEMCRGNVIPLQGKELNYRLFS